MKINNRKVDNELFKNYVYAVRVVRRSGSEWADLERRRIHNLLLEDAGTTRADDGFCSQLDSEVSIILSNEPTDPVYLHGVKVR